MGHHYQQDPVMSLNLLSGDCQNSNFGKQYNYIIIKYMLLFFVCRLSMTRAVLIAMSCTFFSMFNIPVFWPILVLYFIVLFAITMKRQIKVSISIVVASPVILFML